MRQRIERRVALASREVSGTQLDRLAEYLELLSRWNRRMNLTSLADPDEAIDRLIVEPVVAAGYIDSSARTLVDVGSGGGSPAVPLKIARDELSLTMIEVRVRKSVFLREVARHLGLSNVMVETARFEDVLARRPSKSFDVLSIRAVRAEASRLALFGDALRSGGQQLWFLGESQSVPQAEVPFVVERNVPLSHTLRSRLLVLRKTG